MYQLQTEVQKAQTENESQVRHSLRCASLAETPQLQEEVRSMHYELVKAEQVDPVLNYLIILLLIYKHQ